MTDEKGNVTCDDGMQLGSVEDVLENGKAFMDLFELLDSIDIG